MDNNPLIQQVEKLEITLDVYFDAFHKAKTSGKDQSLYIWDIKDDTYSYLICDYTDEMPDVVTMPAIKKSFFYKEPIL